jgi:mannosyltransferase OCH1-like enzyme
MLNRTLQKGTLSQHIIDRQELYIKIKDRKEKMDKHNDMIRINNSYMRLNIPFSLKSTYNSIIPLHLYTCWHTKDLPPLMKQNYEKLIIDNPEFNVYLYDEDECRDFIQTHFSQTVLNAYNALIPCSYKSDLWRFCVLYINGGVYLDIKYQCVNNFKLIALTEKEYFVRDILEGNTYTALIITLPKNEILLKCINQIVENVNNKFYGNTSLDPTGPGLLGSFFSNDEKSAFEMFHACTVIEHKLNEYYMVYNDSIILSNYIDYRVEQFQYQKNKYYTLLWEDKSIYDCCEQNIDITPATNVEIVVARYNESLCWMNEYPFNQFEYIIYNKGSNDNFEKKHVKKIITLENVGRCDHTYLYHLIENYENLSNIVVFFTGSLGTLPMKKNKAITILNNIILSSFKNAYFIGTYHNCLKTNYKDFVIDHYSCTGYENYSKNSETHLNKCKLRPYAKWYKYFFGTTTAHWSTLGGIFSIDTRDIIQHPKTKYISILQTVNTHSNPEAGHYIERSWGVIFYPLKYTLKQDETLDTS